MHACVRAFLSLSVCILGIERGREGGKQTERERERARERESERETQQDTHCAGKNTGKMLPSLDAPRISWNPLRVARPSDASAYTQIRWPWALGVQTFLGVESGFGSAFRKGLQLRGWDLVMQTPTLDTP